MGVALGVAVRVGVVVKACISAYEAEGMPRTATPTRHRPVVARPASYTHSSCAAGGYGAESSQSPGPGTCSGSGGAATA